MWSIYDFVKKRHHDNLDYFSGATKAKNLSKRSGGRVELNFVEDGYVVGYLVFYNGVCTKKYTEKE